MPGNLSCIELSDGTVDVSHIRRAVEIIVSSVVKCDSNGIPSQRIVCFMNILNAVDIFSPSALKICSAFALSSQSTRIVTLVVAIKSSPSALLYLLCTYIVHQKAYFVNINFRKMENNVLFQS
mgnify:CR=1 FL=1